MYKTADNRELVIYEDKGPAADLGKMDVMTPDGVKVPAGQGSEAYLREVLRRDTELRDVVLHDRGLCDGLLEGTTSVRYQLVRPDASGRVSVTEFVIDQSKLDIRDWLGN